ncbi:MAG: hypothetical protein KTR35_18000 [Gammaproteobacteria bacterium]|nr:hypothetical protein [Gammaproteobacteria bacterium]
MSENKMYNENLDHWNTFSQDQRRSGETRTLIVIGIAHIVLKIQNREPHSSEITVTT